MCLANPLAYRSNRPTTIPWLAAAWLKLAKADEKLKDTAAARAAYTKNLAVAPEAKDAAETRKKLEKMK
jgi:predicted TPR repeat methyltransferase